MHCGSEVTFEIQMENLKDPGDLQCALALYNEKNQRVVLFHTLYQSNMTFRSTADGKKKLICTRAESSGHAGRISASS